MLLQNQEAAERSSREENLYHLKESLVGGLELDEVRGSQETNTSPFKFHSTSSKGGKKWFSQQQSRRKRKVLKEGEESELYGIFPRGGPFFDGKTPFLFPLVD